MKESKADGMKSYSKIGSMTIPSGDGSWFELLGLFTDTDIRADYIFAFYVQSPQTSVGYVADEAYFVEAAELTLSREGLLFNGDFELNSFTSSASWEPLVATLTYVTDDCASVSFIYHFSLKFKL